MRTKKVSAAQEDYLEAILALEATGSRVRVRDLAERLSVHKSTVTAALKALTEKKLIEYEPYGRIVMTQAGRGRAERVSRYHAVVKSFLTEVLLIDSMVAEENACRIEHVLDRGVLDRLTSFAAFMDQSVTEGKSFVERFSEYLKAV